MKYSFKRSCRVCVLSICLAAGLIWSCSEDPAVELPEDLAELENLTLIDPDTTPIQNAEPEPLVTYGETEEIIIGRIGDFSIGEDGRVYVADFSEQVIHVYDEDGTHVNQVGGEGEGPGEFRQLRSISIGENSLHAFDTPRMIVSRFDIETLQHLDDLDIGYEPDFSGSYFFHPYELDLVSDGNYLVHFGMGFSMEEVDPDFEPKHIGLIFNVAENSFKADTAYSIRANESIVDRDGSGMRVMSVSYNRTSHAGYNAGKIMTGWSDTPLFKWVNENGEYSHALYMPYNNPELSRSQIRELYENREEPWRGMIRNDDHPETWPAYTSVLQDDEGNIWAGFFTDDPDIYRWMSFHADGKITNDFEWPRHKTLRAVKNNMLYAMETDPDTGLQQVVKYRLP